MMMCWIHKLRAMVSGRPMDEHAARCPACAADRASERVLENRLRNAVELREAPFGFANRVLARTGSPIVDEPEISRVPWPTFAAGAAAFLLLCLVSIQPQGTRKQMAPAMARRQNPPAESPEAILAELPAISPAQIGHLGARLDQPLEKELHYMISDTRQAIQFVASNFIPDER